MFAGRTVANSAGYFRNPFPARYFQGCNFIFIVVVSASGEAVRLARQLKTAEYPERPIRLAQPCEEPTSPAPNQIRLDGYL